MGNVRVRKETGNLFMDFRFRGIRCREQTALTDTPANRKKLKVILQRIEAEITLGQFDYAKYFPNSVILQKFQSVDSAPAPIEGTPPFETFAMEWLQEMQIQWRDSHRDTVLLTLRKHLIPAFSTTPIGEIKKADILRFRSSLSTVSGLKTERLSPSRINHIMTPLRMILHEAANRYEFTSPYHGIKSLKVPRTDVAPFTLEEVNLLLARVRQDYRSYYLVRFFTGMRTSEINGLKWQFVDFTRRQILIREALVQGKVVYTKNDGSFRAIDMSEPVYRALMEQKALTEKYDYVFCSKAGTPINHHNFTNRVWYPLLRHLDLPLRRPYQTRHTAATLWLAAGESPEWIALQMGHATTEMLFRVYSRFVPNLTRQDGSAFERLLKASLNY